MSQRLGQVRSLARWYLWAALPGATRRCPRRGPTSCGSSASTVRAAHPTSPKRHRAFLRDSNESDRAFARGVASTHVCATGATILQNGELDEWRNELERAVLEQRKDQVHKLRDLCTPCVAWVASSKRGRRIFEAHLHTCPRLWCDHGRHARMIMPQRRHSKPTSRAARWLTAERRSGQSLQSLRRQMTRNPRDVARREMIWLRDFLCILYTG